MAHQNKEIEIKVIVERIQPLLDFLQAHATAKGEKHQIDEYFSPADSTRDFLNARPVNQWLRLRDASGITMLEGSRRTAMNLRLK